MSRRVVVTGGAGFIGSHLVDALCELGYPVTVVDDLSAGTRENVHEKAELVVADVRDVALLERAFRGADVVFHLAAVPRVQVSIQEPIRTGSVNIGGTMNALVAAQATSVRRFVFASSSSVYGNPESLPANEGLKPNPLSPYAAHKQVGETLCRVWSSVYGLETTALRFFNVYGPRFDPNGPYALVIGKFITQRLRGEPMTICGDGEQSRDFTHVFDVVRACIGAMRSPKQFVDGKQFNIGSGRPVTVNEIARLIGGPVTFLPERKGEPRHTHADNCNAQVCLGWHPTISIERGIADLKQLFGLQ